MSERPRLRAPAGNGEVLAVPSLERAADLVACNRARLGGRIRDLARRELLALVGQAFQPDTTVPARRASAGTLQEPLAGASGWEKPLAGASGCDRHKRQAGKPDLLFLAGHQPELFHPGVWVKNFALAGLAHQLGGLAVNLIIDTDTVKSTSLRVPVPGDPPAVRAIAFDTFREETPWEERRVIDRDTFARFGDEVAGHLRRWGYEPIVGELWPAVCAHSDGPMGLAFSAARQALERRWGCDNREVPMSALSEGEGFAHFAGTLLADLERFHRSYNGIVRAFRVRHRIRSRNHPVPDLIARDGWLEVPLWGWRAGERRGRLLARIEGDRLYLSTGGEPWPTLPAPHLRDDFVASWLDLGRQGYKVRPRALTTTLFARLFLADLFIHGIGGAIYDELTDEIIREFFHLEAPEFMVVSATARLPLPVSADTIAERDRLARQLRDIEFNPQRHLAGESFAPLLAARSEWVARRPETKAGRRERYRQLRQLNEQLRAPLVGRQAALRRELAEVERQLRVNASLMRRDYAFCMYPESVLRDLTAAIATRSSRPSGSYRSG